MCLAFKAKVVAVESGKLTVESESGEMREVIPFIEKIRKGDTVLVQQGFAVERMGKG